MKQYHVGVAAEAYATALFARAGYEVSVQYGANQPGYDLVVAGNSTPKKLSVKGTTRHGWALTVKYKKKGSDYHQAADAWVLSLKDPELLHCFVQLRGVAFDAMPRIYLASTQEVAKYLKASRGGHGYTALRESYKWSSGKASGTTDVIPEAWRMTQERITALIGPPST